MEGVNPVPPPYVPASKRIAAGLCALFLGTFGVHKFVLNYPMAGAVHLIVAVVGVPVISLFTCGVGFIVLGPIVWLIPFIEGIVYLAKSDAEFVRTYQLGRREWF